MRIFFLLLLGLIVTGCQTTDNKPIKISQADIAKSSANSIGKWVSYSRICAEYRGSGADDLKIKALEERYETDLAFQKGHEEIGSLRGYDSVTGLNQCEKAEAIVDAAYNYDKKLAKQELKPSSASTNKNEKKFYLDVAWEHLLDEREIFAVMVKQVGRVGHVKSAKLIGGKKCDAIFRFDDAGTGDWEVTCFDGTRAVGVLQTRGKGKGSFGSGFDAEGNKIDFTIIPAS